MMTSCSSAERLKHNPVFSGSGRFNVAVPADTAYQAQFRAPVARRTERTSTPCRLVGVF